jgi:hypothetical protein
MDSDYDDPCPDDTLGSANPSICNDVRNDNRDVVVESLSREGQSDAPSRSRPYVSGSTLR